MVTQALFTSAFTLVSENELNSKQNKPESELGLPAP